MSDVTGDSYLPPDEVLFEHSYLVARDVRPLSLIGHCPADRMVMLRVATRIEIAASPGAVPFVIDHGDETASFGYAGAAWALDLYEWANNSKRVPQEQRHRINGLLLGYSVTAIARHDEETSGRRFIARTPGHSASAGVARREILDLMSDGQPWTGAALGRRRGTSGNAATNVLRRMISESDPPVRQRPDGKYEIVPPQPSGT